MKDKYTRRTICDVHGVLVVVRAQMTGLRRLVVSRHAAAAISRLPETSVDALYLRERLQRCVTRSHEFSCHECWSNFFPVCLT